MPFPLFDEDFEQLLTETFRRLVLDALVKARRLSEDFRDRLLSFGHSGGFSVYGRHLILNEEPARLAHMARYAVRPPVAMDRVHEGDDGQVLLDIPPDPKTGATVLSLDPLEWLRRVTNQIPAKGSHMVRYFGAYANRLRKLYRDPEGGVTEDRADSEPPLPKSRASWARLLRKVFEVDPLICLRCGAQMKVISVITEGAVIDQLLKHVRGRAEDHGDDAFDPALPRRRSAERPAQGISKGRNRPRGGTLISRVGEKPVLRAETGGGAKKRAEVGSGEPRGHSPGAGERGEVQGWEGLRRWGGVTVRWPVSPSALRWRELRD